jgi:hypothetical protein
MRKFRALSTYSTLSFPPPPSLLLSSFSLHHIFPLLSTKLQVRVKSEPNPWLHNKTAKRFTEQIRMMRRDVTTIYNTQGKFSGQQMLEEAVKFTYKKIIYIYIYTYTYIYIHIHTTM